MADRLILDLTGSFAIYMAKHTVTHIHTPWMLTCEQVLRVTREGAVPHPLLNIFFRVVLRLKSAVDQILQVPSAEVVASKL